MNDSSNKQGENGGRSPLSKTGWLQSLGSFLRVKLDVIFGLKPWKQKLMGKLGINEWNLYNMIEESIRENGKACYLVVLEGLFFKENTYKWWNFDTRLGGYTVNYPRICPCCGDRADSSLSLQWAWRTGGWGAETVTKLRSEIPYCKRCLRHKKYYERLYWPFDCCQIVGAVLLFFGIMAYSENNFLIALTCLTGAFLVAFLAVYSFRAARRKENRWSIGKCYTKKNAVRFWFDPKNSSKIQIYLFNNAKYAYEFAMMNESLAADLKMMEIGAEDLKA
jgi:hypothetical protein